MSTAALDQPVRTCVGCRSRAAKSELARLVLVDGRLAFDFEGRLPGRGAHVHLVTECVRAAVDRRGLNRAFRREVAVDLLTEWLNRNESPAGA